jgi:hypothetical protein
MKRILPVLIGLLCVPAFAQPTVVDADSTLVSSNTTCTVSLTVSGSDTFLYAGFGIENSGTIFDAPPSTVTYNGDSLTEIQSVTGDGGGTRATMTISTWGRINPDAGTHDLVATWADTQTDLICGGATLSGVHQSSPLGTPNAGQADNGPATVDVTSATGELVLATVHAMSFALTEGAGQTGLWSQTGTTNSNGGGEGSSEAGASTVTMSWTIGASGFDDRWLISGVSIKPPGGAATAPTRSLLGVGQ